MKKINQVAFFIVVTISLCSLSVLLLKISPKSTTSFYSNNDWDALRFPLIEPYEVVQIQAKNGWFMNLQLPFEDRESDMKPYGSIEGIEKIDVENNIIMVYTPLVDNTAVSLNYKIAHWFVLVPIENIETGFESEKDFKEFVATFGIYNFNWETPDNLHKRFVNTGCLEWIPNCK